MSEGRNWIKPAILAGVLAGAGGLGVAAAKSGGWGHGGCEARHGGGHMPGMFAPGRHIDGKLAFLKAELQISAEQEAAWEAFVDVVRRNETARAEQWEAHRREKREGGPENDQAPALNERIDRGIAFMEQRVAAFKEIGDAAKTLYGELTAEQQARADRMMSRRHGRFGF